MEEENQERVEENEKLNAEVAECQWEFMMLASRVDEVFQQTAAVVGPPKTEEPTRGSSSNLELAWEEDSPITSPENEAVRQL